MKHFIKTYLGVLLGGLYAFVLRLIFNCDYSEDMFSLFSFTFIWIAPIVIGLIPLFYAHDKQLRDWSYRIASPAVTVIVFFIICFLTRVEDLICLWVILIPFVLAAMACGLIAGEIIERIRERKKKIVPILILPFLLCPMEQQLEQPVQQYKVTTRVIIHASPEIIWSNIIRVPQIKESEYQKGFFNYAGIPRPLYAELNKDTLGATRIGHFEGGLQFIETVNAWERNRHIGFDISVVPSSIRSTIFDQHILKGHHFKFLNADYMLKPLADGQTELTLSSSYQLSSNINAYGAFCGDQLLSDFQTRLLNVIKQRCDKH